MTHRTGEDSVPNRPREALSRRGLLASVGAGTLGIVAGCSSGGDGGGGDGADGDGSSDGSDGGADADSTVQDLCSRIPGEFVAYDTGATPVICDFDIPSTFEGESMDNRFPGQTAFQVNSDVTTSGGIVLAVRQTFPKSRPSAETPVEYSLRPEVLDIEFNGETVTFYGPVSTETNSPYTDMSSLHGNLSYTFADTKLYFPVSVSTNLDASGESIPSDCRPSVEEVTRRITESLRVNEETTVADELEDRWDDPP